MAINKIPNNLYLVKDGARSARILSFEPRITPPDTVLQDFEADLKRLQVLLQQAHQVLSNAQGRWFSLHESHKNLKRSNARHADAS